RGPPPAYERMDSWTRPARSPTFSVHHRRESVMFLGASWPVRLLGHLPVPGSGSVFAAAAFRHAYSINPQETNMLRALRAFWLAAACLFVVATQANAQVVYQTQPASKLWIEGTSNKSD